MAAPAIPFVRELDAKPGECLQVTPRTRRIIAGNPGPFTFTGSGSYLIGAPEIAVIDPGPDDKVHLERLLHAAGPGRITHILVTHTHLDHCGGAAALKAATGAPVFAYGPHGPAIDGSGAGAPVRLDEAGAELEEGADRSFRPDAALRHGDVLTGPDWTIEVLHTPGHTSNHLCFALKEDGALFTGDHVMGWSTSVILPPDGDMADYMASLEMLRTRPETSLWPTHGPPIREPEVFLRALIAHRRGREEQVRSALAQGPKDLASLVAHIYADVDKRLHPAAARMMTAHLIRMAEAGEIACDPPAPDDPAQDDPRAACLLPGTLYRTA